MYAIQTTIDPVFPVQTQRRTPKRPVIAPSYNFMRRKRPKLAIKNDFVRNYACVARLMSYVEILREGAKLICVSHLLCCFNENATALIF